MQRSRRPGWGFRSGGRPRAGARAFVGRSRGKRAAIITLPRTRAQDRLLLGVILPLQSGPFVDRFLDTTRPVSH